jgi:hypothetical protein
MKPSTDLLEANMEPLSTSEQKFLAVIERWIVQDGEVFVVFRIAYGAGSKWFEFFDDSGAFRRRIAQLQPADSVIVLRGSHLPLRGEVDDDLIAQAKKTIADGEDWLIVCLDQITMGKVSWFHDYPGNTHAELEEELRDDFCFGKRVAFGLEPPYGVDSDTVLSAYVPNADGSVTRAVY